MHSNKHHTFIVTSECSLHVMYQLNCAFVLELFFLFVICEKIQQIFISWQETCLEEANPGISCMMQELSHECYFCLWLNIGGGFGSKKTSLAPPPPAYCLHLSQVRKYGHWHILFSLLTHSSPAHFGKISVFHLFCKNMQNFMQMSWFSGQIKK